jgi:hypothetical protein
MTKNLKIRENSSVISWHRSKSSRVLFLLHSRKFKASCFQAIVATKSERMFLIHFKVKYAAVRFSIYVYKLKNRDKG